MNLKEKIKLAKDKLEWGQSLTKSQIKKIIESVEGLTFTEETYNGYRETRSGCNRYVTTRKKATFKKYRIVGSTGEIFNVDSQLNVGCMGYLTRFIAYGLEDYIKEPIK